MRDHKSLVAWQVANEVSRAAVRLCRSRWKPYAAGLFEQLQRASLSVQLNLAEGYALHQQPRFRYHLRVAYGSAIETTELLELAAAEGVIPPAELEPLITSAHRSERLLLGLLHSTAVSGKR
jgi:four helix bundle protein